MKFLITILLGLSTSIIYGQQTVVVKDTLGLDSLIMTYYDNEQLFYQTPYYNGKQNGQSLQYHRNGQLCEVTEWIDGIIKDGYDEFYNDQGKIQERGYYKNGKLSGTWEV